MKVCLLAPANNPHTRKLALTLAQKGNSVHVITFHNARLDGITVKYFPPIIHHLRKINYILNVPRITRYLRSINPDILHAHYVSSYGVVCYLTRIHPFIISVWGKDIYGAPNKLLLRYLITRTLGRADIVMSTSRTMAAQTALYCRNRDIVVTPFGIDLDQFRPRKKNVTNRFILGTARGLYEKYGIRYLIEAFSIFSRVAGNAELHIAGKGTQRQMLESLAARLGVEDKTKFHGFVDPARIPEFLQHLDVFCMPSIEESESFGVAALEAQACGIPVIASKIGGLQETVVDGTTGYLIPPKNIDAMVEKMTLLYHDKITRKRMGVQGREFVKQNYDWKKNFMLFQENYTALYGKY